MHKHEFTKCATLFVMLLFATLTYAQKVTVKGVVVDGQTQEPMIGLTIKEKGQTTGAVTNIDGQYAISVPSNATLVFSYMGYKTVDDYDQILADWYAAGGQAMIDAVNKYYGSAE